jgi:hypothetical protein
MGRLLYADGTPMTTANDMRLYTAALWTPATGVGASMRFSGRSGVRAGPTVAGVGPLQIAPTSPTPDWNIKVANGTAVIEATRVETSGVYTIVQDTDLILAVAPPDPTNPRWDGVVARVRDINVTGLTTSGVVEVVPGTPAAVPALPATPDNSLLIGYVYVAPGDTAVTTSRVFDQRVFTVAHGGVLPVRGDSDMPASPYLGQHVYRLDWHETWRYGGSSPAWHAVNSLEQYISGTSAAAGNIITATVAVSAGRIGQLLKVSGEMWTTNAGSAEPGMIVSVDAANMAPSNVRFNRGTSVNTHGGTFAMASTISAAGTKTVRVAVSGSGTAGTWTAHAVVEIG